MTIPCSQYVDELSRSETVIFKHGYALATKKGSTCSGISGAESVLVYIWYDAPGRPEMTRGRTLHQVMKVFESARRSKSEPEREWL